MSSTIQQYQVDLGAIERASVKQPEGGRLLFNERDYAGASERFRLLAHRIRRRGQPRTVLMTSSIPKEGKTTLAVNFSIVLARNGRRVLLIDADLRRPSVYRALGLPELPGLTEVLEGELTFQHALRRLEPLGLYYLPAGCPSENPVPLLEGDVFANLLTAAQEAFEWIIIDSPPMIPFTDAYCIAARADCVLVVTRRNHTRLPELERALSGFEGTALVGIVPNEFDEPNQDRYYYSYYGKSESK